MNILAIDPGPELSSYVLINQDYSILEMGDYTTDALLIRLENNIGQHTTIDVVLIEKIVSYGQIASNALLDTARVEGKLWQQCQKEMLPCHLIPRKEYGKAIVGRGHVSDVAIYRALKLRLGWGKNTPQEFRGSTHRRSAFALAVYWLDCQKIKGG